MWAGPGEPTPVKTQPGILSSSMEELRGVWAACMSQGSWVGVTPHIPRVLVLVLERDHRAFAAELGA